MAERSAALLSLGSINADFQVRVSSEDPAETLAAHDMLRSAGGKAANRAWFAQRHGIPATLIGCVGDDDLAAQALAPFAAVAVDTRSVTPVTGTPTAVSMISVLPSGKKRIVLSGNANDCWPDVARRRLADAVTGAGPHDVLSVDFEVPAEVAAAALDAARRRGLRTVVDPSFPARVPRHALQGLSALTPNVEEACALLGADASAGDPATLARALRARGCEVVCVKLADGGCIVADAQGLQHIASGDVRVVDATGAGDAFTAAFAVALVDGLDARAAALRGVAASQLAVGVYGSQASYAGRDAIDALAAALAGGVRGLAAT